MITQELADRIDNLTKRAVRHFDYMVEVQLKHGPTHYHYYNSKAAYERALLALGKAMTDAVGLPGQRRRM